MKCQSCSNPATVHLTDIKDGLKREIHLCEECAEKQQFLKNQELNLSAIVQAVIGQHMPGLADEMANIWPGPTVEIAAAAKAGIVAALATRARRD